MKRSSLPFLLAAFIALAVGFSFQHDPSLDPNVFESQFRSAIRQAGFATLAEAELSADEVALPLTIRLHPRRWRTPEAASPQAPDAVERFSLSRTNSTRVECYVRTLDGRVQLIEIRAPQSETIDAADLRVALRQRFPGLPVTLRME